MVNTNSNWQLKLSNLANLRFVIFLLSVLAIGGFLAFSSTSQPTGGDGEGPNDITPTVFLTQSPSEDVLIPSDATTTLILGTYEGDKAIIYALNDDGTNRWPLAMLDKNIKYVRLVSEAGSSADLLFYIGETDEFDRGKKLIQHRISTNEEGELVVAEAGWFIDDYRVSPDGSLIAWWEIKPDPGHESEHTKFASRVYVAPILQPARKKLVVSEHSVTNEILHLPLFFDGENNLYLDRFKPSEYAFYLGLVNYNYSTNSLSQVLNLESGGYNSDPVLIPEKKSIVFTSFNPNASVKLSPGGTEATREEVINRNMVVIYSLETGDISVVLDPKDNTQYGNLSVNPNGDKIAFEMYKLLLNSQNELKPESQGFFNVNIDGSSLEQIVDNNDPSVRLGAIGYTYGVDNPELLFYTKTSQRGSLGPVITQIPALFYAANINTQNLRRVPVTPTGLMQYIAYVQKPKGAPLGSSVPDTDILRPEDAFSLQLGTFAFKPVVRAGSNPRTDCVNDWENRGYPSYEACERCPIYFYPEKETEVEVDVRNISIFNSNIENGENKFNIIAYKDGTILPIAKSTDRSTESIKYNSINFDFSSQLTIVPSKGIVVSEKEVYSKLEEYASKVGLQGKEIEEFNRYIYNSLPLSPYYLISHYEADEANRILPLKFNPVPDSFINIVFYISPLTSPKEILPPSFTPISREGFTIVSWSVVLDRKVD